MWDEHGFSCLRDCTEMLKQKLCLIANAHFGRFASTQLEAQVKWVCLNCFSEVLRLRSACIKEIFLASAPSQSLSQQENKKFVGLNKANRYPGCSITDIQGSSSEHDRTGKWREGAWGPECLLLILLSTAYL